MTKRYATLEEAQTMQAGVTGDTFIVEGVLFERFENDEAYCYVAWHDLERSSTWDVVKQNEVADLLALSQR